MFVVMQISTLLRHLDSIRQGVLQAARLLKPFSPEDTFSMIWSGFAIMCHLMQLLLIPIKLCFNVQHPLMQAALYFAEIFFLLNIITQMNTAYYFKGTLIFNRGKLLETT